MPRLRAEHSLLLMIDWQARLLPALPYGQEALKVSCRLAKGAGLMTVPVLVTEHCADKLGTTNSALLDALTDPAILPKASFSALGDAGLREALTDRGRKQIVVSGAETHVCVMQTVLDLLDEGWSVYVVRDAVASRHTRDYKAALERMQQSGAVIVTSEMVLFEWQARADTGTMRAMLELVR